MTPELPDDVLFLICSQLQELNEFHTLFCCAVASKRLAVPALSNLYRIQDVAPVTSGGPDDASGRVGQDTTAGWARLWRTLVLSSLGQTAYPYCRYVRVLDLNDLQLLLEDNRFRSAYSADFFAGDMARFLVEYEPAGAAAPPVGTGGKGGGPRAKRQRRFNPAAIVQRVGDALTEHTPMVQELAGSIDSASLTRWLPRLRHLQRLRLWDGPEVNGIAPLLCEHCHHFRALMFYQARAEQSDQVLARFLSDLKPGTFQSFHVTGSLMADDAIFAAFNNHASSLTDLRLEDLPGRAMLNLAQMSSCTALETLHVKLFTAVDPPGPDGGGGDYVRDIVAWLRSCKNLDDVDFDARYQSKDLFLNILTPLLLDSDVHLTKLSVSTYNAGDAADFHKAIANQAPSLASLYLRADGENGDADALVHSLTHLHKLTDMRLQSISDYFQNRHFIALAENMQHLEELWVSGWAITDDIWQSLNSLRNLRRLEINAFSSFTFEGVMEFINRLGADQRAFFLGIMMADHTTDLAQNEEEQALLRETLALKLDGRFEFTVARDPDAADFDSASDSD